MSTTARYTILGIVFGIVFPIMAIVIRILEFGVNETYRLALSDPLLWIIATAPLFLGGAAYIAGVKQENSEKLLSEITLQREKLQSNELLLKESYEQFRQGLSGFNSILEAIAQFDLSVKLPDSLKGTTEEYNTLFEKFQTTLTNLNDVVSSIFTTAASVNGISETINKATEQVVSLHRDQEYIFTQSVAIIEDNNRDSSAIGSQIRVVEEVLQNVHSNTQSISFILKDMIHSISTGNETRHEVLMDMEELQGSKSQIKQQANFIENIAKKISLVALNASIEAARAGNEGRSFAVVANEIQRLADSTTASVKNIEKVNSSIESSITRVLESFKGIDTFFKEQNDYFTRIQESLSESLSSIDRVTQNSGQLFLLIDNSQSHLQMLFDSLLQSKEVFDNSLAYIESVKSSSDVLMSSTHSLQKSVKQFSLSP